MNLLDRLLPLDPLTVDNLIRFWLKVDRKGLDDCWPWLAHCTETGHGQFTYQNRTYYAHRISYYVHNMKDPGRILVCHDCNNPGCQNPKHLYLGTNQENAQQAHDQGRCNRNGELNSLVKLREFEVLEIREDAANGVRPVVLARKYKVCDSTIREIVARRSWTHI